MSEFKADVIAHWPTGPFKLCIRHAQSICEIGKVMGVHVYTEPITDLNDHTDCKNCINEMKSRGVPS